jgi:hypothetical protein
MEVGEIGIKQRIFGPAFPKSLCPWNSCRNRRIRKAKERVGSRIYARRQAGFEKLKGQKL